MLPELSQVLVRFREILTVRSIAFEKVRHRIEPEPVDSHIAPEIKHFEHRPPYLGILEVEIRLMRIEAVPVVILCDRVPRPVRGFKILEDDSGLRVLRGTVVPDVVVTVASAGSSRASFLKPHVLV